VVGKKIVGENEWEIQGDGVEFQLGLEYLILHELKEEHLRQF
jgi:hypothetical protein